MSLESKTPLVNQSISEARAQHSAELKELHIGPLWEIYRKVLTARPRRREVPYLWSWEKIRPHLLRAGELITAAEAERRALMMLNPGNDAGLGATATLYAAAQLILPGEIARAHRHSPSALRFIIEGEGAYTCVEGEKIAMLPGDLILTPSMLWHDHGNEGSEPVMWLDGLDIPLTDSLRYVFMEEMESTTQMIAKPLKYSEKLHGHSLFPSNEGSLPLSACSPVMCYRWKDAREALEYLHRSGASDPYAGYILRYANPASGGEAFPTMGCRLQLIPRGSSTKAHRHTNSAIYHVADGSGYSVLDGVRFDWHKGDTFAVPGWDWHEHAAPDQDAVLFSITDRPVLSQLGMLRSENFEKYDGHQPLR